MVYVEEEEMPRRRRKEVAATVLHRWRASIEEISQDLVRALGRHRTWQECEALWGSNHALWVKNDVRGWMLKAHTDSIVVAIRRETESGPKVASLRNLLAELARNAHVVTVASYVDLSPPGSPYRAIAEHDTRDWVAPGTNHLDPEIPRRDLAELERDSELVTAYVNREVAHRSRAPRTKPLPTFGDLSSALERMEAIAGRYNRILRGTSYVTFHATRQFDHTLFVRRAWTRPRWSKLPWPDGFAQREGEFRSSFDVLRRDDLFTLWRARHRVFGAFATAWSWEAPTSAPIRDTLTSLGLPDSDAAVLWVRDRLLQRDRDRY
jgi:hypothetical protein